MAKIKVFTDSPADVPVETIQKLNMGLFPVKIHFGEETYRDYIDISVKEFYKKLSKAEDIPTTSQITIIEFYEGFKKAALEGYDTIICFTLPPEASGTFQNANLAKEMLNDEMRNIDITIIPGSLAYIYGRLAKEAAVMAMENKSKQEILERVEYLKNNCYVIFVVDTLKYLKKGGRINPAVAAIGEVLNIKPMLTVKEGLVSVVEKIRGNKKLIHRIMELLKENGIEQAKEVYIFDGDADDKVDLIKENLKEYFNITNTEIAPVGPVIGTHAGPGVVGVLFFK